jgi:hypothetical protein
MSIKNTIDMEKLRQKYLDNPPDGYSKAEIQRMRDEDLLDMDYFLNEDSYDLDDWD